MTRVLPILLLLTGAFLPFENAYAQEFEGLGAKTKPKMQRVSYYDDKKFNMEAFSVLVPEGWSLKGDITFLEHPALPRSITIEVTNPEDTMGVHAFVSDIRYIWGLGITANMMQAGTVDGGYLAQPRMTTLEVVNKYFVPENQKKYSLFMITGTAADPSSAQEYLSKSPLNIYKSMSGMLDYREAEGIRIDFEYVAAGVRVTGEARIVVEVIKSSQSNYMEVGYYLWGPAHGVAYKAPIGELTNGMPLLKEIFNSFQYNPAWVSALDEAIADNYDPLAKLEREKAKLMVRKKALEECEALFKDWEGTYGSWPGRMSLDEYIERFDAWQTKADDLLKTLAGTMDREDEGGALQSLVKMLDAFAEFNRAGLYMLLVIKELEKGEKADRPVLEERLAAAAEQLGVAAAKLVQLYEYDKNQHGEKESFAPSFAERLVSLHKLTLDRLNGSGISLDLEMFKGASNGLRAFTGEK
jgi:hypothetical protein